jgi:phage replication-related protein YjqB (UPF0714/DUF867 family)
VPRSRRWLLARAGTAALAGSAGCLSTDDGDETPPPTDSPTATRAATDGAGGLAYRDVTLRSGTVDGPAAGESYCELPPELADALGVAPGMQLRVGAADPDPDAPFGEQLFTVAGVEGSVPGGSVRARPDDMADLGGTDGAGGRVSAVVPHPEYDSRTAAETHDEIAGRVVNPGRVGAAPVVVLAPHGGYVERWTGRQAVHAARSYDLPGWACFGFNEGGRAYDRWHVTSTELDPRSFPGLATVTGEAHPAAVAFHGQSDEHVTVGGTASALRERVADALRAAYEADGADVAVRVADGGENAGVDPDNVVNWATEQGDGGVQVEQPPAVRESATTAVRTAEVVLETMLEAAE